MPSQRPDVVDAPRARLGARLGLAQDGVDAVATRVGRMAGRREQLALAHLGLPAADRAAAAGRAVRVDGHVADLAGVTRPTPVSGRPSTIRPPPTPTSPETNSTLSTPTAAPRRCSPSDAGVGVVGDA